MVTCGASDARRRCCWLKSSPPGRVNRLRLPALGGQRRTRNSEPYAHRTIRKFVGGAGAAWVRPSTTPTSCPSWPAPLPSEPAVSVASMAHVRRWLGIEAKYIGQVVDGVACRLKVHCRCATWGSTDSSCTPRSSPPRSRTAGRHTAGTAPLHAAPATASMKTPVASLVERLRAAPTSEGARRRPSPPPATLSSYCPPPTCRSVERTGCRVGVLQVRSSRASRPR